MKINLILKKQRLLEDGVVSGSGSKEAGRVDKQNPTNSDKLKALIMQELAAISQDVAQKLIDSMPGRTAELLKKKGQCCKYWLFP